MSGFVRVGDGRDGRPEFGETSEFERSCILSVYTVQYGELWGNLQGALQSTNRKPERFKDECAGAQERRSVR